MMYSIDLSTPAQLRPLSTAPSSGHSHAPWHTATPWQRCCVCPLPRTLRNPHTLGSSLPLSTWFQCQSLNATFLPCLSWKH